MYDMKLTILALIVISCISMAGMSLDRVNSDFGHGCQFYTYTNSMADVKNVASPTSEIIVRYDGKYKASDVSSGAWYALENVTRSHEVWDESAGCHAVRMPCDPKNSSGLEKDGYTCDEKEHVYMTEECGAWKTESFQSEEWVPFRSAKELPAGKTRLKYCATYRMAPTGKGWAAEFDMVPSFDGVRYPEYAWFNTSWAYRQKCPYNASNVTENLNYMLVPCSINTSALIAAGKMNGTCKDIRAVDDDETTALAYTIENGTCNSTYFNTTVWAGVNVTANTTGYFYVYYGNNASADAQDAATLYVNAGIMSIWHGSGSGDDELNLNDVGATAASASTTTNSSRCYTGGCFNYTTGNGYWTKASSTHPTGSNARMVSMWVWTNQNLVNYIHLYDMGTLTTGNGETFYYKTDSTFKYGQYGASEDTAIASVPASAFINNLTYIAYRVNGAASIDAWMDGTKKSTTVADTTITSGRINIGGSAEEWGEAGPATIDEVRLYNTTKTDAWVEAERTLFAYAGTEETAPTSAGPEILNITLAPALPNTDDSLSCQFYARDNDSSVLNLTAMWYLNGAFSQNSTGLINQPANATYAFTLPHSQTDIGENWSCTGYASDGTGSGTSSSGNVTIQNRAPTISLGLIPAYPYNDSVMACAVTAGDDDGETLSGTIVWYLNGNATAYTAPWGGAPGIYTDNLGATLEDGQNWSCWSDADDGTDSVSGFSVNRTIQPRGGFTTIFNFTRNYTFDDYEGYISDFYSDWIDYILAIIACAVSFILGKTYSQIFLMSGVGLFAVFLLGSNPIVLAGAVLMILMSMIVKYVTGG